MSLYQTTLPGTFAGLLRPGSPVWYRDEETPWLVTAVFENELTIVPQKGLALGLDVCADEVALQLDDPTGFMHATWWVLERLTERRFAIKHQLDKGGYPLECAVWHSAMGGWALWHPSFTKGSVWFLKSDYKGMMVGTPDFVTDVFGDLDHSVWTDEVRIEALRRLAHRLEEGRV